MLMWIMSDRAIPRSFRFMEGFGVHTFRLVNAEGQSTFVKFHWKPKPGLQSVVWNEARQDQRRRPGLPPPRPVGRHHRRATSPSGSSASSCSTRTSPTGSPSTCSTPPSSSPRRRCRSAGSAAWCSTGWSDNFFAETEQVGVLHRRTSSPASTSPTTRCSRAATSPTSTPSSSGWAARTSPTCPSTRPSARSRTSSRTATWRSSNPTGPRQLRAQLLGARRGGPREDPAAASHVIPTATETGRAQAAGSGRRASPTTTARPGSSIVSQTEVEQRHISHAFTFELSKVRPGRSGADGRRSAQRRTTTWPAPSPRASASAELPAATAPSPERRSTTCRRRRR